jgi:ornithine cyclodeaminase/alanine dehydrogenase-like protein (mu-crystallin family)
VIGRNPDRRDRFIERMQPRVKAGLAASNSSKESVQSSQIITTITTSREPVFEGAWLQPGTHINAAGGNVLLRRELDDDSILRAKTLVVDSLEQAKIEAGEFLPVIQSGRRHWEDFVELRDVVAGLKPARTNPGDITIFKSLGLALEDVALGKFIYERALTQGRGRRLTT